MNVFTMLFLFVISVVVILAANVAGRRGQSASLLGGFLVLLSFGYVVTLPIYTVGWIIAKLFS